MDRHNPFLLYPLKKGKRSKRFVEALHEYDENIGFTNVKNFTQKLLSNLLYERRRLTVSMTISHAKSGRALMGEGFRTHNNNPESTDLTVCLC